MHRRRHFTKELAEDDQLKNGKPKSPASYSPRSSSSFGRTTPNVSVVEINRPVTDPGTARRYWAQSASWQKTTGSMQPNVSSNAAYVTNNQRPTTKGWQTDMDARRNNDFKNSGSLGLEVDVKPVRHDASTHKRHSHKQKAIGVDGDRVLFTDSPSVPGVQIVYRLEADKKANPEKLYLDRRKLSLCPIIEGENNLRLLNFQHNAISKIQRLSGLRQLIFLDFYDNEIEEIVGLSTLKSLRVLMLGKNRIRRIENLQELKKLDVLDLHGNKIVRIENLSHLNELRVLNLAGNQIQHTGGLLGLTSLTELNLRRNKISKLYEIDTLYNLQRLFLSFNKITSCHDVGCLDGASALVEVSLDGNDFAAYADYRQSVVKLVSSLKQLDMQPISDEERHIANVMARKDDEKRRENDKRTTLKEQRQNVIFNAQKQWLAENNLEDADDQPHDRVSDMDSLSDSGKEHREEISDVPKGVAQVQMLRKVHRSDACRLAEIDGSLLNVYGDGALEAIERNWGEKSVAMVTTVSFTYVSYDAIIPYFGKLRARFPSVLNLIFTQTNICTLMQFSALASFRQLDSLVIDPNGNPVTSLSLWKSYLLFRLSHLCLKTVNNAKVSQSDVVRAERLFGPLGRLTDKLPRLCHLGNTTEKQKGKTASESNERTGLTYDASGIYEQKSEVRHERNEFSKHLIREIVQMSHLANRKQSSLDSLWTHLFRDIVKDLAVNMKDLEHYGMMALNKLNES